MTSTKINNRQFDDNLINLDKEKTLNKEEVMFIDKRIASALLSTREAAMFLSVSPNALRIMVHRNQVKSYKLGKRLRFNLEDLLNLLRKKEA